MPTSFLNSPSAKPIHAVEQYANIDDLRQKLYSALSDTEILASDNTNDPEFAEIFRLLEEAIDALKHATSGDNIAESHHTAERIGDSFEDLKVLLEQALAMANRLRVDYPELDTAYSQINSARNAVGESEKLVFDRMYPADEDSIIDASGTYSR